MTDQTQDWGQKNYLKGCYKAFVGSSMTMVWARDAHEAREEVARILRIDGTGERTMAQLRKHPEWRGEPRLPRRPELIARIVVAPATLEDMNAWARIEIEASATYRKEVTIRLKAERRQLRLAV
jgi:hypothetical protein